MTPCLGLGFVSLNREKEQKGKHERSKMQDNDSSSSCTGLGYSLIATQKGDQYSTMTSESGGVGRDSRLFVSPVSEKKLIQAWVAVRSLAGFPICYPPTGLIRDPGDPPNPRIVEFHTHSVFALD